VFGVAVDSAGRLFIADGATNRVRMVDGSGTVTTVAGSGPIGELAGSFCGDGGPATSACLRRPHHVMVDPAGRLFITDAWNYRIRVVEAPLQLSKTLVSGCMTVKGTVTLASPAPAGGLTVSLASANPHVVVPASVVIKAGATKKIFSIATSAVATRETATIEAGVAGRVLVTTLTLKPMGPKSVTLTPNPVVGGTPVAGMVTLECPAGPGDIEIALTSTKAFIAEPTTDTILIPFGAQALPFEVRTTPVFAPVDVTVKATANEVTKSRKLTMTPVP
jgi:hypothetical protein